MLLAIERRNKIESNIERALLPKNPDLEDFKDIAWANSEEALIERLKKIKALQLEAALKFKEENEGQFLKRINKQRANREKEIRSESKEEASRFVLTCVLKAITTSLDAHTNYFTPSEAAQFMIQVQQKLFGIGALLKDNLNGFLISRILDKGPCAKSKNIKINDLIIAVDGKSVIGLDLPEGVEMIRGKKGSKITLTIIRDNGKESEKKI